MDDKKLTIVLLTLWKILGKAVSLQKKEGVFKMGNKIMIKEDKSILMVWKNFNIFLLGKTYYLI